MNPLLYAALCVVVPVAWGLVVVWISNRIEGAVGRRLAASKKKRRAPPPTQYHI